MIRPSRRALLTAILGGSAFAPWVFDRVFAGTPPPRELTPACTDHAEPTIAETEGPFFKPNAPLRRELRQDAPKGEPMMLAGFVFDQRCRPIANAAVQLWHADESGAYDNAGFRLRGYQLTDHQGRWWFDTIVPARYPGRTRHYHVKVQRAGGPVLTTQLYFPGEPGNRHDPLFNDKLLMQFPEVDAGMLGRYDFVLS